MVKKIVIATGLFLISMSTILNSAHAGGGRRGVSNAPEPVSCILVLAGGATLAVVRRLRNRKNSKNSTQDTDNSAL